MANSLGLDKTIKATESITAKLVRIRAIFQLLDLWLEWKDIQDPARTFELAKHLQLLVGLSSGKRASRELKDWLPERLLIYVEHELDSVTGVLAKLTVDRMQIARIRGHLEEIRFCCQIVRLIYQLERHADPNRANLQLSQDQITQAIEFTVASPTTPRVYAKLFSKSIKLVTRTSEIWRDLQRESKSFLTGADPKQAS